MHLRPQTTSARSRHYTDRIARSGKIINITTLIAAVITASFAVMQLVTSDELWKAVDTSTIQQRWRVQARKPGRLLRLTTQNRIPGHAWLDMRVESMSGHKGHHDQRLIFYTCGIAGRVYWYGGLPLHRRRFRATFGDVVARARAT